MATTKYIEIRLSNYDPGPPASNYYRFKVIGMNKRGRKGQAVRETLSGQLDVVFGKVVTSYRYVFRVPHETSETGMGEWADLQTLYGIIDPNGTPSSEFTLVDHWGNSHTGCFLIGDLISEPLTTILEGETGSASYIVPVEIIIP